jgi:hypothetical protein
MKRTDVTYGQIDNALRGLGFSCRIVSEEPATRIYEHQGSGAWITLPQFPEDDLAYDYHLAGVQTTLDGFGIADAKHFDATLHKAG